MHLSLVTITVRDYDEAIAFYTLVLGFALLEDTDLGAGKRWVRVGPQSADRADAPAFLLHNELAKLRHLYARIASRQSS